jgi:PAS domain S-box-containing protein
MSAEEELRLKQRIAELEAQLSESQTVLSAIYNREVDGVVVRGSAGEQVFTLHGAEQPYRVMVETMAEGALTVAPDGTVLHGNRASAQLFGRPLPELIGSRLADFVAAEHQESFATLLLKARENHRCDIKLIRAGGATVPVRLSSSPLDLEELPGAICMVVLDLTDQERSLALEVEQRAARAREEMLRERQAALEAVNGKLASANRRVMTLYAELSDTARKLRHADENKTRFLANMSHEFRGPLNSIFALTGLLLCRADGDLSAEQEKQVAYIRKAADSLLDLVNDLLDLAKIEAGKIEVRVGEFTAAELFATLRGMLPPSLTTPAVRLVFENPDGVPGLLTDEAKVAQILRNFIHNALKFTEHGEVRVAARHDQENDFVVFSVSDTGIGIAADDQERIFDEFTQVENPVQSKVKGTGLGLPLCRKLAGLLNGRIALQSEPGAGATFSLLLPRRYLPPLSEAPGAMAPDDGSQTPTAGGDEPVANREFSQATVLIIDDDPAARHVMSGFVDSLGCFAHEAANAATGLRLAREIRPELVLLDINLPAVSGLEVLQLLKGDPEMRALRVVVVTSADLSEAERREIGRHACAIIDKSALSRERLAELLGQENGQAEKQEDREKNGRADATRGDKESKQENRETMETSRAGQMG